MKKPRGKPFEKGTDARRNTEGQRNSEAVAFSRQLRALIVSEGEKTLTLDNGNKITKVEAMIQRVWSEAIKGEQWATVFIAERVEGKVTQPISFGKMTDAELRDFIAQQLGAIGSGVSGGE